MEVRLFAYFRDNRKKVEDIPWVEGIDGYALLDALDIAADDVSIFLVNGHRKDPSIKLNPDDMIALFPPVGGG